VFYNNESRYQFIVSGFFYGDEVLQVFLTRSEIQPLFWIQYICTSLYIIYRTDFFLGANPAIRFKRSSLNSNKK
jgi:hypothetical protein